MRIDAYNHITQAYKPGKQTTTSVASQTKGFDQIEISQSGIDYQIAKKAIAESGDIREAKVAQLKSQMQAGTYQVDANKFASKLIEKYQQIYL